MFPELTSRFEEADTPYLLWFELRDAFEDAYEKDSPDEFLIRRIYQYSDWCCDQPEGRTAEDDLATCVAVCFYEHIPIHPKARADMPRWWKPQDIGDENSIFAYHMSEEEFRKLKDFIARERHRYDPNLRAIV